MPLRPDRILRWTALFCTGVLALSACGGGTASGAGDDDGVVTIASQRPVTTLDPHGDMGSDLGTQLAGRAIFDRLVGASDEGYEPELASEWTVSDDATEWEFTLRDDAVFSDSEPVTADDVVASIERVQDLEGPVADQVADVTTEAVDASTVSFTSEAGDPALLGNLANVWIVPGERVDDKDFFAEPIGSGPYTVESFTPEETLVLAPNPDYWGGAPGVEGLEIQYIPEIAARMTALRTGEVDLTWGVPDDQVPELEASGEITLETVASDATYTMWINSGRDAFADAEVRRALWQAVDFEGIIESLHPETGELANSIVAPPVFGHAPQEPVEHDPDGARQILDDADFDFDATYELQLRGTEFQEFAQAVTSDLREIGVQVEAVEKEPGVWLDDLLALEWDINLQSVSVPSLDAATNVGRLYTCEAERTGYCDEDLDELLAQADSVADPEERESLYVEATEIIWDEAVGMFPMFPQIVYAWRDGLTGVDLDSSAVPGFSDLELEDGS